MCLINTDTNIDFMASMRIVPLLLMILKWPLDTSNLMTTVLCIETLAEQNGKLIMKIAL